MVIFTMNLISCLIMISKYITYSLKYVKNNLDFYYLKNKNQGENSI